MTETLTPMLHDGETVPEILETYHFTVNFTIRLICTPSKPEARNYPGLIS